MGLREKFKARTTRERERLKKVRANLRDENRKQRAEKRKAG